MSSDRLTRFISRPYINYESLQNFILGLVRDFQTFLQILILPAPYISESCIKKIYEDLKGLQKTFWDTTNKCENKNLS